MEFLTYEKSCKEVMLEIETLWEHRKDALKNFTRKKYPACFQSVMEKYKQLFQTIEEIYLQESGGEEFLGLLSEYLVQSAERMIKSQKWKFQRENMQADCNIFLIAYIVPLILTYEKETSDILAKKVLEKWNDTFQTKMEAGSYEQILAGFRTGIFGISFGEGK